MKVGDVVSVTETDHTDTDVVSPALVTHVYSDADSEGDSEWWGKVQDKGLADVVVIRRDGSIAPLRGVGKSETYTDDEGRTRKRAGTYETSASDTASAPAEAPSTVTDSGQGQGWMSPNLPGAQGA